MITDDVPLVTVVGTPGNRPHGHIALGALDGTRVIADFVYWGSGQLHLWIGTSVTLDPDGADALAEELRLWAIWARQRSDPRMEPMLW